MPLSLGIECSPARAEPHSDAGLVELALAGSSVDGLVRHVRFVREVDGLEEQLRSRSEEITGRKVELCVVLYDDVVFALRGVAGVSPALEHVVVLIVERDLARESPSLEAEGAVEHVIRLTRQACLQTARQLGVGIGERVVAVHSEPGQRAREKAELLLGRDLEAENAPRA